MTATDSVQQLFDSALSAVPDRNSSSPHALHQRLHRRNSRMRFAGLASAALVIVIASTVVLSSSPSSNNVANAVTLYPQSTTSISSSQLNSDRNILAARLRSDGYAGATVKIVNSALVVENGPKNLADPAAILTSSPALLIRKVLCFSGPLTVSATSRPLPADCSSHLYTLPKSTPDQNGGVSIPSVKPDPALAAYPTTSPAEDRAHPYAVALLPLAYNAHQRLLVGSTLITLTPRVASGTVTKASIGGWMVNVRLDKAESRIWDGVAAANFHFMLAIDFNGRIVESPYIEPSATAFYSLDGSMQLWAPTKVDADALMAVLRSGPLAIPLASQPSMAAPSVN
jgi:preprotein translocase subunit SecD